VDGGTLLLHTIHAASRTALHSPPTTQQRQHPPAPPQPQATPTPKWRLRGWLPLFYHIFYVLRAASAARVASCSAFAFRCSKESVTRCFPLQQGERAGDARLSQARAGSGRAQPPQRVRHVAWGARLLSGQALSRRRGLRFVARPPREPQLDHVEPFKYDARHVEVDDPLGGRRELAVLPTWLALKTRRRKELINQLMGCPRSDIPSWGRAPPLIHNHTPKGGADFGWCGHPSSSMQSAASLCTRPVCLCLSIRPPYNTAQSRRS
jgi:hypothetical protein